MLSHYAALCSATYSRRASFIRVCQPSPVALKYARTSGLYRTVTATFVGRLCGPRLPGMRTSPFAQNCATACASLGSYGHSGSSTRSGAASNAAAICSLLKPKGLEVRSCFMLVTIPTGNYWGAVFALGPFQENDSSLKPTQALQPLFAVGFPFVLHRDQGRVKHAAKIRKVNAVSFQVLGSLAFVPCDHSVTVVTNNEARQAVCRYKMCSNPEPPF